MITKQNSKNWIILFYILPFQLLSNTPAASDPPSKSEISRVTYYVTEDIRYKLNPCDFEEQELTHTDYVLFNSSSVTKKVVKTFSPDQNEYEMEISIIDSDNMFPEWSVKPSRFVYANEKVTIYDSKGNQINSFKQGEKARAIQNMAKTENLNLTEKYLSSPKFNSDQFDILTNHGFQHHEHSKDLHIFTSDETRITINNNTNFFSSELFDRGEVIKKESRILTTVQDFTVPTMKRSIVKHIDRKDRKYERTITETFFGYSFETEFQGTKNRSNSKKVSNEDVTLYPNPFQDNLILEVPSDSKVNSIKLFDITGVELPISYEVTNNKLELNLSSFPNNRYFLLLDINNNSVVKTIIKQD